MGTIVMWIVKVNYIGLKHAEYCPFWFYFEVWWCHSESISVSHSTIFTWGVAGRKESPSLPIDRSQIHWNWLLCIKISFYGLIGLNFQPPIYFMAVFSFVPPVLTLLCSKYLIILSWIIVNGEYLMACGKCKPLCCKLVTTKCQLKLFGMDMDLTFHISPLEILHQGLA